jgi:polyhydroxyalkanoate synthesis regulator phasin
MQIGFRVPPDIAIALRKHLDVTGLEKTKYMLSLIRQDLGIAKIETLVEKVESLDSRVSKLEAKSW